MWPTRKSAAAESIRLLQRGRRDGLRSRLDECVEVGEDGVGQNLLGVWRHLQARRTNVARERLVGKTVRSETWSSRRRSLCFAAVALRAADFHEPDATLLDAAGASHAGAWR